ncbi:hypothetical protein JZM24_09150 [Candidatus Sodalis endolongispinus]|uniref:Uncharacterized protein n=1 Tax=Candidatus Sodalis endolongispinus TaxID=2812662 RepID=A0ABS5YB54_9GAMM|nr:hypothetical protein [Candidatus Sodalis endolongispinus]MBT9432250.1 hypothetical protein [Candidatus Sodalis endolongispinus]
MADPESQAGRLILGEQSVITQDPLVMPESRVLAARGPRKRRKNKENKPLYTVQQERQPVVVLTPLSESRLNSLSNNAEEFSLDQQPENFCQIDLMTEEKDKIKGKELITYHKRNRTISLIESKMAKENIVLIVKQKIIFF